MSQFFQIHPETPQKRLITQAVDILRKGGVIVYPTDSAYAIGCHLGDKQAADRIKRIRRLDDKHNFTLVCRDLSDIGVYAKVGVEGSLVARDLFLDGTVLASSARVDKRTAVGEAVLGLGLAFGL